MLRDRCETCVFFEEHPKGTTGLGACRNAMPTINPQTLRGMWPTVSRDDACPDHEEPTAYYPLNEGEPDEDVEDDD